MTVEAVLYGRATGHAGLSALIGNRFYPVLVPQNETGDAVSYQRIGAERVTASGANPGLVRARFQFDAWSATHPGMRALAEQLRQAFERWNTAGPPVVQDVHFLNELEDFEPATRQHRGTLDFEVIYEE